MGVREWFVGLLSRGEPPEVDRDELVDFELLPLTAGPMLVSALREEGVDAVGIEAFDVVTETRTQMRIMVRRRDLATATEIAARVR